jgi:hypothetical protein
VVERDLDSVLPRQTLASAIPEAFDHERSLDLVKLRGYRLRRVQEQLQARDFGAVCCMTP